jgi:hypothetical protein
MGLQVLLVAMAEKMIALRSEIPESLHIRLKVCCALDRTNIKEKIAELVEGYVEQKEKK